MNIRSPHPPPLLSGVEVGPLPVIPAAAGLEVAAALPTAPTDVGVREALLPKPLVNSGRVRLLAPLDRPLEVPPRMFELGRPAPPRPKSECGGRLRRCLV